MANYVNQSTQTEISGLTRDAALLPAALFARPPRDTPTPPEDMMAVDKPQLSAEDTPTITKTNTNNLNESPTLLLRRKNRPKLEARISMPEVVRLDAETPRSPPPTEAVMSPLPLQNRLYAGHTPIIPRSMSPLADPEEDDDEIVGETAQTDDALSGPLTLPPQPGDGTEDTIPLSVLDATLERLRLQQEGEIPAAAPNHPGETVERESESVSRVSTHDSPSSRSRTSPTKLRRQSADADVLAVDGVLLKKPRINFGAPIGQA
ncbi:hypothetical protein CC80DRAFT_531461 [Byssothecium circinans]|uniref:Uncharacterized protein n=1 Tax=Byssothecium circinans TaxID=147558 RepID=A0A6A5U9P8_9PLEO|nr:hypothetical protein CC80DRAFT_531461 [Byssothecium circinans]